MNKLELMKTANEVRKGIVTAVHSAKSGHPGGSLSAADIYTYLYFEEMNIDPKDPKKADRDRFVLSKGHTAPGYYSTLAHRGFFPVEDLTTLRKVGSYLQGHPDMKHIPGVDMSSGSLGQGISAAVGMAISAKLSNDDYRVYTLLGDGEIQEGQVWEASMLAGHRKLDNLVVIVDNNNLQIDGKITDVNSPYPIDKKFEAFNFHVINVDAHDFDALRKAFDEAKATKGMPTAIIAKSIKGKGVSFMENQASWHGVAPNDEEYAQECYTLVKQLKLENVIFTGRVDIVKYMEKLDFTILTSISEGQPLSVLESLAARRPCVTTDVGCCRELLEGKEGDFFGPAGYCVPPMYRQGLAAAMDKMCESRSLRLRMGANGQNRVNKYYRHERMMKEYKKLYGEVETAYGWNRI